MRFFSFLGSAALGLAFMALPHVGAAQPSGGLPVKPTRNTQYVFRNGVVYERIGSQATPLVRNIRLPNGTKVNVKSGIVEFPSGKITSLHEGDYLNAEGGLVFATPASAAAARGDYAVAANAKYDQYVHVGTVIAPAAVPGVNADSAAVREVLLQQKIELLNRKITLLQQTHPNAPSTSAVDKQLQTIDARLSSMKKP
ncbi:hypothetical protein HHL22_07245 [Hymenobacter sp. RP-2-7]|uniref:DUF6799 domain-containing protein n=1 Tax=Hymenobacter polaris TaxID=2682546 RepID=A0A7Y0ACU1_9BACT|nr:DUF6799 domain-containing protein [Hymenobacter polaris]NML64999.1 hypothetical protein [Hymenobacter polaris]